MLLDTDVLIDALNGQALLGRPIVVHHARPRQPHGYTDRARDEHLSHGRGPGRRHDRLR